MATLLVVQAHPHVSKSYSLQVQRHFLNHYQQIHPSDKIIIRDLFTKPVPPLNATTLTVREKQRQHAPLAIDEEANFQEHQAWLNEFLVADKYVFTNPMYNLFLPAELKQYIDLIAVPHKTFKYTSTGPVGLLKDKSVVHIQASGDQYTGTPQAKLDLGSMYLKTIMGLFGIQENNYHQIFVEGLDWGNADGEKILSNCFDQAEKIAERI